ncbi:MAG: twin-arginine translocase TatA/TatE family subunit [Anaerolineales bacterium]|jgi:Sec-independent protein translocase protein TatA|nr:twin-arginine translocase TatA/TatE family subunit [Anaerolineales bacterium]
MEILGIGVSELVFIVIIALIVLGPKDMQKAGKTIGKWMRDIVTSEGWKVFQQTSRELRTLPNKLMREANDELGRIQKDINFNTASSPDAERARASNNLPRSQPYSPTSAPTDSPGNKIAPQTEEQKKSESDP